MSRVYILDATTLGVIGLVDQSFSKLVYTRRYQAADTFTLEINSRRLYANSITNGCLIYLPDDGDRVFLVEQIETTREGTLAKDLMTVTGRSLEGISMVERRCIPPVGSAYDSVSSAAAETAIKHYVNANAVSAVDANRNIPNLQIVADSGRGTAVNVDARYQAVMDICAQIGQLAGMGWEVTFDSAAKKFNFDVIVGRNLSASVFFDFTFETLAKWDALDSALDSKTVAIVAGQGEGVDRDVVIRGSASGFSRREAFIDARDVTQGSTDVLTTRGDAFLAQASISKSIDATVHQFGSFQYMRDWDLGDIILVRDAQSGTSYSARVIEIEVTIKDTAASPTVVATLGKPWPTIQNQLSDSSSSAGGTADGGVGIAGVVAGGDLSGTYPNPTVVDDSHNHTHATLTDEFDSTVPVTQAFGDTAATGAATSAARRDHKHGMPTVFDTTAPSTQAFGDTASAGTATTAAHRDHKHGIPAVFDTTAPVTQAFGDAAAAGTATVAAHRDHKHGMPANPVPAFGAVGDIVAEASGSTAAAGATGKIADAGHRHAMPTLQNLTAGAASDIVNIDGVSPAAAGATGHYADAGHEHQLAIPATQTGAASSNTVSVATTGWARQQNPSPSFVPAYTGQKFLILAFISGSYSVATANLMMNLVVDNDLSGTQNTAGELMVVQGNEVTISNHMEFVAGGIFTAAAGDVGATRYARVGWQAVNAGTWSAYTGSAFYSSPIIVIPLG